MSGSLAFFPGVSLVGVLVVIEIAAVVVILGRILIVDVWLGTARKTHAKGPRKPSSESEGTIRYLEMGGR